MGMLYGGVVVGRSGCRAEKFMGRVVVGRSSCRVR